LTNREYVRTGVYRAVTAAIIGICLLAVPAGNALAHGVALTYEIRPGVVIIARYDSGEPLAGAQVTVFTPDNPAEPWLTGTSDASGRFYFTPDPGMPGLWEVQVRLAGHGGLIRIAVEEDGAAAGAAGASGFTTLQKLIMVLALLWGSAGTAMFFSRRKTDAHS
jgi:nickel transport protein